MATSGENTCPPVGRNRWPLTAAAPDEPRSTRSAPPPSTRSPTTRSTCAAKRAARRQQRTRHPYVHALHVGNDGHDLVTFGVYTDELTRYADRWRITARGYQEIHRQGDPTVFPPPDHADPRRLR
jgi:hypothetical protein